MRLRIIRFHLGQNTVAKGGGRSLANHLEDVGGLLTRIIGPPKWIFIDPPLEYINFIVQASSVTFF